MHVVLLHRRGSRGNDRPLAAARYRLSVVIAAGALLLIMPPVIGVTGHAELRRRALIAPLRSGGIHTRTIRFIAHPGGDAGPFCCQRPARPLALVAWYGGQDWPALLPGVACGGAERLSPAHCGG